MKERYYGLDDNNLVIPIPGYAAWIEWSIPNGQRFELALAECGDYAVRTVFLGRDHGDERLPLFETLISGGPHDGEIVPADSWADAHHKHVQVCELLAAEAVRSIGPDDPSPFV
jgi:hypothetical protein